MRFSKPIFLLISLSIKGLTKRELKLRLSFSNVDKTYNYTDPRINRIDTEKN